MRKLKSMANSIDVFMFHCACCVEKSADCKKAMTSCGANYKLLRKKDSIGGGGSACDLRSSLPKVSFLRVRRHDSSVDLEVVYHKANS